MTLRVLDLFSGIGGFSLGLERAGMKTVAFCEIDPFCRRVLRKHWPDVPIYEDVRTLTAARLAADGIIAIDDVADAASGRDERSSELSGPPFQPFSRRQTGVDLICGGFPCQDISVAGKGAGIDGERSGLWSEYARIIGEARPRYVIVENVAALLGRGLDRVLGDLAALGFDAEWHCIPASAVGAPHRRDRLWLVAYASGAERRPLDNPCGYIQRADGLPQRQEGSGRSKPNGEALAHADNQRELQSRRREPNIGRRPGNGCSQGNAAHANSTRLPASWPQPIGTYWRDTGGMFAAGDWWGAEPDVGRVAHGVPARVDRLRSLGNAVVPQLAEIIGRAIISAEAA